MHIHILCVRINVCVPYNEVYGVDFIAKREKPHVYRSTDCIGKFLHKLVVLTLIILFDIINKLSK